MTYAPTGLWDFQFPADSLTTVPDDDFLAILQSQLAAGQAGSSNDASALFLNNPSLTQNIPLSANPKAIQRLPDTSVTASPLTDSSPSPSSGQEGLEHQNGHQGVNGHRRTSTNDDYLKRKAFEDDDDDDGDDNQPPTQRSHIGDKGQSKNGRRKSGGVSNPDEARLLKRKEQNRAAQRAFRERKEKHVKDLEDHIAALEAKNDSTVSENENLKEMLRRLQTENSLLKQAAFTFSVPRATPPTKPSPPTDTTSLTNQFMAPQFGKQPTSKERHGSGSSTQTSPASLFDDNLGEGSNYSGSGSSPETSANKKLKGSSAMNGNANLPTPNGSEPSFDFLSASNWGTPPASQAPQSPFTIISSNPTYMSYRDPSPAQYTPFNMLGSSQPPYSSMMSPSPVSPYYPPQFAQQSFLTPDITMGEFNAGMSNAGMPNMGVSNGGMSSSSNDLPAFTFSPIGTSNDIGNLDELFGNSYQSNGFTSASYNFSPGPSSGPSPVSQQPSPNTRLSPSEQSSSSSTRNSDACPKELLAQMVADKGQSSFADPNVRQISFQDGRVIINGKPLESTEKNDMNVDIATALKKIQSHPKYKDIDINSLCSEFAAKACCDGEKAVITPENMNAMMDCMARKMENLEQHQTPV